MKITINCKHCDRYLFTAVSTTLVEQMVCPNSSCKAKLNIKVVSASSSDDDVRFKFESKETEGKRARR